MFNANNARTKSDTELEELTDAIAAEFEDRAQGMTTQEKKALASNLLDMLSNATSVTAFASGQFAQNNAGQPAAQLGNSSGQQGGSQSSPSSGQGVSTQEALQVIANDPRFSGLATMLQRAALGMQSPGNPAGVEFDANGDDKRIAGLRQQLSSVESARDQAEQDKADVKRELQDERDPNKQGSLAKQLADAQAASSTPADTMLKADVKASLEDIKTDVEALHGPMNARVTGKQQLQDKLQRGIDAL